MTPADEHRPSGSRVGPDVAVQRELPKIKTADDALKAAADAGPTEERQTPEQARTGMQSYMDEVYSRLDELSEFITSRSAKLVHVPEETRYTVSPVNNKIFQRFLSDTLAEVAMRYVTTGRFTKPGLPNDDPPQQHGAPETLVDMPDGIDPALIRHPAARLAVSQGLDLMTDGDDED